MPDAENYNDKDAWMSECIDKMTGEGKDQDQAIAACSSMWEAKSINPGDVSLDAMKIGARNSSKDARNLQSIHDLAVENGAMCGQDAAGKTHNVSINVTMPEGLDTKTLTSSVRDAVLTAQKSTQAVAGSNSAPQWLRDEMAYDAVRESKTTKSADDIGGAPAAMIYGAVKAIGDWELDVLGVPFGGPNGGKDSDNEYFSEKTNLGLDRFGKPLITYYHGLTPDGKPQGEPEIIGEAVSYERKSDGIWWRVALNKTSQLARRVWEAAKQGAARASSGSIAHLVRKASDGHITNWPVIELTLIDAAGRRQPANQYAVALPVAQKTYKAAGKPLPLSLEDTMNEEELKAMVADAIKTDRAQRDAELAEQKKRQDEIDAAVKAERERWEAEAAKANRLPGGGNMPYVTRYNDTKFDGLSVGEQAFLVQVADRAYRSGRAETPASDLALKSLALKAESEEKKGNSHAHEGMKTLGLTSGKAVKADEINRSTLASYGDEWVGVMYHSDLWEKIRAGTWVLQALEAGGDVRQVPDGFESDVVPLESTDPTWYKVAQAADNTNGRPDVTVTSSRIGTAQKAVALAKMGCRVEFTGEMVEDSLIRWVPNAYRQIQTSGMEQMEHAIIDGDTATGGTTNINDIAGTPAATNLFLLVDGFRKLGLVTNTANSRAGGVLTVEDFLETAKLMGVAGIGGADRSKVGFIIDPWTAWKSLELPEVKTKDTYSQPTIEGGVLKELWGYKINTSYFMHYAGVQLGTVTTAAYQLKANSAGKVDQDTEANNIYGAILAVRWDQWALRWKRRMTLEVDRWPESDTNQIVAMTRWGMSYRDTEAAAITYGVTV